MWTSGNFVALGPFLFGTAYLWLAAASTSAPNRTAWTPTNLLAYVAVIGFAAAAWGECQWRADLPGQGFRVIGASRLGYFGSARPKDATPAERADAHALLLDHQSASRSGR